jgi:DnaJ-class molecular chaperone
MQADEIRALSRMLDRMDYYRLLRVERGAPIGEIRSAYHRSRREFHPDSFLAASGELRSAVDRIAKRVTEGYVVLRDSRRRASYDQGLDRGCLRYTQESEAAEREATRASLGATPNGRRFFSMALEAERAGDLVRALGQLKMALTFEPGNKHFRARLEELQARRGAAGAR